MKASKELSAAGITRRRTVLAALGALVAVYLVWRAVFTLNPQHLVASLLFLLADCLTGFSTLGLVFSLWDPRPARPAPAPASGLAVDVWIPTYNEDVDLLRRTIHSCVRLDYPHETWVLDDGNRPAVKALAERLGARYLARGNNEHGKAGNLNHALARAGGDFIAVFDADFIPRRDFLSRLLGYFRDAGVALVQAPQRYYNQNSFQHRRLPRRTWNEQSSFFDLIMPGRNNCNAAFWIGTNAVLRRRAVEEAGGFAVESVTEDMLTSIRVHARGWRSVYVNEPLAYGLAPVNVRQFLIQRLRWARGASRIFFGHNPLFRAGLRAKQRLCYLFSVMHFFDGLPRLVYYALPALYLLFGISPVARGHAAVWVILGYILAVIATLTLLTRGGLSFFHDELYAMIRFPTYLAGNAAALFRRRARFAVTPKDHRMKGGGLFILGPAAVLCLNAAALFSKGFLFLHGGFTSPLFLFSLVLCGYFSVVAVAALVISFSRPKTDSFLVHDSVFVTLAGDDGTETCPVKAWNEASAVVLSRIPRPVGGETSLSVAGSVSGIRARVAGRTVRASGRGSRVYEYELAFPGLAESEKLRLIDLVFQDGVRRQDGDAGRRHAVRMAPLFAGPGDGVLALAGRAPGRMLAVRYPEPVPAGAHLPVAFAPRPEKKLDFEVRSCVPDHGGVSLLGSLGRRSGRFRGLRPALSLRPRRAVHVPKLAAAVGLLLGAAFLLDSSRRFARPRAVDPLDVAPSAEGVVARHGHLRVRDGALRDERGTPVRLRGLSSHGPQWFPLEPGAAIPNAVTCFGPEAIRLAVYVEAFKDGRFWNGYAAQPEYMLDRVDLAVRDAINAGVYVIVCWHLHSDPLEYASEAGRFFAVVSARWGGYPNVLFEIANEPEGGVPWDHVRRYAAGGPGDPDGGVIGVIRRHDPDGRPNVVIVGTPFWSQRPDLVLADPLGGVENVMYAFHFYAASHKDEVRANAQKALDAGLPLFVTEWGTAWHLSDGPMDLASSRRWLDWMDHNGLSWINWSLSVCDETTSLLKPAASTAGPWTDADLTPSGAFVKAELQSRGREPRRETNSRAGTAHDRRRD